MNYKASSKVAHHPAESVLQRHVWLIAGIWLLITAITDALTGYQFSLLAFYFFPVATVAWHRGRAAGLLVSAVAAAVWLSCDFLKDHVYTNEAIRYWNAFMRLIVFSICSISYSSLRKALRAREEIIHELQTALDQVSTLSGYLPTCPCCHRIRVDSGRWQGLEAYVREQSRIEFISVVCPQCGETEVPNSEKSD